MTEGSAQLNIQCGSLPQDGHMVNPAKMAKKQVVVSRLKPQQRRRLYIKEWRKHRGLSQETLAERTGMSVSNLSQLEGNKQGYSWEALQAIADELTGGDPGLLFTVDPTKDDAMWSIWEKARPAERAQIVAVARALVKTGT